MPQTESEPKIMFLEHKATTQTRRQLVVDDAATNREIIVRYLKRVNIECHEAENGKVAVEMNSKNTYDLIWMDMKMPVMDGVEATRRIRNAGFEGPIVGMTGRIDATAQSEYSSAKVSLVLPKPVPKEKIYDVVERLCGY